MSEYIDACLPREQQYNAQLEVLRYIKDVEELVEDDSTFFLKYLSQFKSLEMTEINSKADLEDVKVAATMAEESRPRRDKKARAIERLHASWNCDQGKGLIEYIIEVRRLTGDGCLSSLAKIAKYVTAEKGVELLNTVIIKRMTARQAERKRINQPRVLTTTDIKTASKSCLGNTLALELDTARLAKLGLMVGKLGLLEADSD